MSIDRPQVLVVDDHPIVCRALGALLARELDAEVAQAEGASAALEALRARACDLAIVDVILRGRDGLDLLAEIRERWPKLPVLVITGYADPDLGVRALKGGAAGFLTKSEAPEMLVRVARHLLASGRHVPTEVAERLVRVTAEATLSNRELQVIRLVALGYSRDRIAAELHVSAKTVATYRSRIAKKTGLSTAVEVAAFAFRRGLVH